MLSDKPRIWPQELWDVHEDALRKEVLDRMDELQKLTLAPEPAEGDDMPAKEMEKPL